VLQYICAAVISGKHNVYRMSAASPEEKEEWMKNIKWVFLGCLSLMTYDSYACAVNSHSMISLLQPRPCPLKRTNCGYNWQWWGSFTGWMEGLPVIYLSIIDASQKESSMGLSLSCTNQLLRQGMLQWIQLLYIEIVLCRIVNYWQDSLQGDLLLFYLLRGKCFVCVHSSNPWCRSRWNVAGNHESIYTF